MSQAQPVTFTIKQGDTWLRSLTLTQGEQDTPVDLTGCSIEFSMAPAAGAKPAWVFVDDPDHAIITNPEEGTIKLQLTPEITRAFGRLKRLLYEVTITWSDGVRLTLFEGTLDISFEVADETKQ